MISLITNKVQQLSDLDLAVLVSLVANEHCVFSCDADLIDRLTDELTLICNESFGLHAAVINCDERTTVDDFSQAVLGNVPTELDNASTASQSRGMISGLGKMDSKNSDSRGIASIIIAVRLDRACEAVQTQSLELLRTRRIFTRTAMHVAPENFLFVPILSGPDVRLGRHLNDMFAMSHFHPFSDRLAHLENQKNDIVLPNFLPTEIHILRDKARKVQLAPEIAAYLHNIVVFLRMSRYVNGGVTARATRDLRAVVQALAPLHGIDFVTPSLVVLATKKVYSHRLVLATAKTERSLQWGSDPMAVESLLEGLTVEDAIDAVIATVETPL